jgi:hypothetical protein
VCIRHLTFNYGSSNILKYFIFQYWSSLMLITVIQIVAGFIPNITMLCFVHNLLTILNLEIFILNLQLKHAKQIHEILDKTVITSPPLRFLLYFPFFLRRIFRCNREDIARLFSIPPCK